MMDKHKVVWTHHGALFIILLYLLYCCRRVSGMDNHDSKLKKKKPDSDMSYLFPFYI